MSLYHDPLGKCPVTGEPVPDGYTWTDHDKPGPFNSCLSCCPDGETLRESLARLESNRPPREIADGVLPSIGDKWQRLKPNTTTEDS